MDQFDDNTTTQLVTIDSRRYIFGPQQDRTGGITFFWSPLEGDRSTTQPDDFGRALTVKAAYRLMVEQIRKKYVATTRVLARD